MHEKRFNGDFARLRSAARQELLEVERVVDLVLNGIKPVSMLDIGTGTGLFAEAFARNGVKISGIDANPEMVAVAQQMVPQGNFKEAIAESIPFPEGVFDLVFMGLVWHETDNPAKALQEALRVCVNRVAILEWPYQEGTAGPPLSDRINSQKAEQLIHEAGFKNFDSVRLLNTVLYIIDQPKERWEMDTDPGAQLPLYERIYAVVRQIPKGRVATYGQVAKVTGGCSARMVGYAMGALKEGSEVPWQRVINAKGKISIQGYGAAIQRQMLVEEGIIFNNQDQIDLKKFSFFF